MDFGLAILWCLAIYGVIHLISECVVSITKTVRRIMADHLEYKAHIKEIEQKSNNTKTEIKGFRE